MTSLEKGEEAGLGEYIGRSVRRELEGSRHP